jgi:periplasmic divalent cation tolerance protein
MTASKPDLLLCLCTCPDRATARTLAHALVDERLAACVNLLPGVVSVYRWEGQVEEADEVQLLIKARPARLPALIERLRALHPYTVPELIAFEAVGGLPEYLHWAADQTRDPD